MRLHKPSEFSWHEMSWSYAHFAFMPMPAAHSGCGGGEKKGGHRGSGSEEADGGFETMNFHVLAWMKCDIPASGSRAGGWLPGQNEPTSPRDSLVCLVFYLIHEHSVKGLPSIGNKTHSEMSRLYSHR